MEKVESGDGTDAVSIFFARTRPGETAGAMDQSPGRTLEFPAVAPAFIHTHLLISFDQRLKSLWLTNARLRRHRIRQRHLPHCR
jgi:hypothetical protein